MAMSALVAAAIGSTDLAYDKFQEHYSRPLEDTDTTIVTALRLQYPSLKLVSCDAGIHDLIGFAQAGHATISIIDPQSIQATRSVTTVGTNSQRIESRYDMCELEPGEATDAAAEKRFSTRIKFGRYLYEWENQEYLVYLVHGFSATGGWRDMFHILCEASTDDDTVLASKAIDRLMLAAASWAVTLREEILVFNHGRWTKDAALFESVQSTSWGDVILERSMQSSIMRDVDGFFDAKDMYKDLDVPWKRGIILHGEPGNGKTLSLRALMHSLAERTPPIPTLYVRTFEGANGHERSIQNIFNRARLAAPCMLVFEDLDSLVFDRVKSYFLNEVDGIEANDGILIVATTNYLEKLDPALARRPSRFDKKYLFPSPMKAERIRYCQTWRLALSKKNVYAFPETLCEKIAEITEDFSFAYLKELFLSTLLSLAREGVKVLDNEDAAQPETLILWQRLQAETEILRKDMAAKPVKTATVATNDSDSD